MTTLTDEELLQEFEDLLRTMPPRETLHHRNNPDNQSWLGRTAALIQTWNSSQMIFAGGFIAAVPGGGISSVKAVDQLLTLIHQARHDLRMKTKGPLAVAIDTYNVFDYFDEIRKTVQEAKSDLLFVDPYLDAEFVSRYLGHVAVSVNVRLLARERLASLKPAVEQFAMQSKLHIAVRSAPNFHDRYVFVDRKECYQSGASFKDGAKKAPTTITQITDAFPVVLQTYESLWNAATIVI